MKMNPLPAGGHTSLTRRGFGVGATYESVVCAELGEIFFSSVSVIPLETSGGTLSCSSAVLLFAIVVGVPD